MESDREIGIFPENEVEKEWDVKDISGKTTLKIVCAKIKSFNLLMEFVVFIDVVASDSGPLAVIVACIVVPSVVIFP